MRAVKETKLGKAMVKAGFIYCYIVRKRNGDRYEAHCNSCKKQYKQMLKRIKEEEKFDNLIKKLK